MTLAFYVLRVMILIMAGRKRHEDHRLREAMAVVYTAVAAILIFQATGAIEKFVKTVLDTGSAVQIPPTVTPILAVFAALICTAFLCNFSRSLWMLKSLDHGVFDAVPDWERLTSLPWKRFFEFATRTVAAFLFIKVEHELEMFADSRVTDGLLNAATASALPNYLSAAGLSGLFLYTCLIIWWIVGFWIAKTKMPKKLGAFHLAGLLNSIFIYLYAVHRPSPTWAFAMVLILGIMGISAMYMLVIVAFDLAPGIKTGILWCVRRGKAELTA